MKSFVETVKDYSNWKLKESGNPKLSRQEIMAIREEYKKETSSKKMPKQLKEACNNFLLWKKQNNKGTKIDKVEFNRIKESLHEQNKKDFNQYVHNYKIFKKAANQGTDITSVELKMLKENFRILLDNTKQLREEIDHFNLQKTLREADMGMNPAAPMAGDPNAMAGGAPGMDPMAGGAPGAPADPMALQGAVDAAMAALQPVATGAGNSLGADPNAGLPPVDGTAAPAGGAPQPGLMEATEALLAWKKANGKGEVLTESEKKILNERYGEKTKSEYEKIKERIAEREARIAALQEGAVQDSQRKIDNGRGYPTPVSNSHGGDHTVTEEQVVPPSAGKLANGYSSGAASKETAPAKTWPTKAMGKEAGGALQGAGASQTKMKESGPSTADDEDPTQADENNEAAAQDKMNEAVTVTDIYVQRSFEPKLDFQKIKESMKKGLLG